MWSYDCPAPPGEFEDDELHALWFVEYKDSSGQWCETGIMTWAEATSFVDDVITPENVEYTISRVE